MKTGWNCDIGSLHQQGEIQTRNLNGINNAHYGDKPFYFQDQEGNISVRHFRKKEKRSLVTKHVVISYMPPFCSEREKSCSLDQAILNQHKE